MKEHKNYSYVTLLTTKRYLSGVIALKRSLENVGSEYGLACLVLDEIAETVSTKLECEGIKVIQISHIAELDEIRDGISNKYVSHWKNTFEKFYAFSITEYDKIVFVDCDIFVMKNIDYLFNKPNMTACQDQYSRIANDDIKVFNSGLMVIEPKRTLALDIIEFALKEFSDGGIHNEQSILNAYFENWTSDIELQLPANTNVLMGILDKYDPPLTKDEIECAHFIGKSKPFTEIETFEDGTLCSEIKKEYMDTILDMPAKALSIIIPQYMETRDEIRLALDSIRSQQGIDKSRIETIIIGDCGHMLSREWLYDEYHDINPEYIFLEKNVGAGVARNFGLKEATGKWVTFLDADDAFCSLTALNEAMNYLTNDNYDIIFGLFIRDKGNGTNTVSTHSDATWVHGKFYRADYLSDNGIEFNSKLRVEEDGYFNSLAFQPNTRVACIQYPFVYWRANPDSITRKENGCWIKNHFIDFVLATDLLIEEFKKRKISRIIPTLEGFIVYAYYIMQLSEWELDNKQYRKTITAIKEFVAKNATAFECVSKKHISHQMATRRQDVAKWDMQYMEHHTFSEFAKMVGVKCLE